MFFLTSPLFIFIFGILSIVVLGMAAGFSPTLYFTQITTGASKSVHRRAYTAALIGGVLAAIVVLSLLFQIINLQTLIDLIDSTIHALIIAVVFNIFIAIGLIIGGFWYVNYQSVPKLEKLPTRPTEPATKSKASTSALFSFGFLRTITSISGITATYVASSSIAGVSTDPLQQLFYTAIFLFAAVMPFIIIALFMNHKPEYMQRFVDTLKDFMRQFNYRLTIGITAIIVGCSIFMLQVMTVLFF